MKDYLYICTKKERYPTVRLAERFHKEDAGLRQQSRSSPRLLLGTTTRTSGLLSEAGTRRRSIICQASCSNINSLCCSLNYRLKVTRSMSSLGDIISSTTMTPATAKKTRHSQYWHQQREALIEIRGVEQTYWGHKDPTQRRLGGWVLLSSVRECTCGVGEGGTCAKSKRSRQSCWCKNYEVNRGEMRKL